MTRFSSSSCILDLQLKRNRSMAVPCFARRTYATEGEKPLPTPGDSTAVDPKIAQIVDQIETLTLLQTSELVAQLKVIITTVRISRMLEILIAGL